MYVQDYDETLPYAFMDYLPNYGAWAKWYWVIQPYVKNLGILKCPSDKTPQSDTPYYIDGKWGRNILNSYGWNYPHMPYRPEYAAGTTLTTYEYPSETLVFAHSQCTDAWCRSYVYSAVEFPYPHPTYLTWAPTNGIADVHSGGTTIGFLDGHAKWMKMEAVISGDMARLRRLWGSDAGYR
jgi:prepilin-type processing-associated H-X9-DG protein